MRPINVVSTRQVAGAERRPKPVRKLGEVAVCYEGISKRLLLLCFERQKRGLVDRAILDTARNRVVRRECCSSFRCVRKHGYRRESVQRGHIGGRLRSSLKGH